MTYLWKKLDHFATWLSNLCWSKLYRTRSDKWLKGYKDWKRKHDN